MAVAALLLAVLAPAALRLATDNSPEAFFPRGDPALGWLDIERTVFGRERTIRVVLSGDDLWTPGGLAWVAEVERAVAGVAGIAETLGPASRYVGESWPPADPEGFRRRLLASPLVRDLALVGDGGETLSVVAGLAGDTPSSAVVPALEQTLAARQAAGRRLDLLGLPVLEHALDRSSREVGVLFFPLLGAVVVLLLLSTLRTVGEIAAGLLYVAFCLGTLLGAFGWLGGTLNLVLVVLPPILFVVTLATAVHLLVRCRDLRDEGHPHREAVRLALAQKGRAVFWTGATTCVGFASLASAPVAPVRTLGLTAAVGIAWATMAAFTLLPSLLVLFEPGPHRHGRRSFEAAARRLAFTAARSSVHHRRGVLAATALVALAGATGLPRLTVASNALEYLPAETPLRRAVEHAGRRGMPSASIDLLLVPRDGSRLDSGAAMGRLVELGRELRRVDGVLSVASAGSLLEEARLTSPGLPPGTGDALRLQALAGDPRSRAFLARFVAPEGELARLTLGVRLAGYPELDRLLERVHRQVAATWPDVTVHATGEYPLLLETQRSLLATLGSSAAISLALIAGIFLFLLRSLRLSLVALVPNVLPVLLAFGGLGWVRLPLDIATVMVAAVVLGLAVDDTIHALVGARTRASSQANGEPPIVVAVAANGPAYTLTALLLAAGFGVCAASGFAPTARFGMLASLATFLVWIGALWLLPALVTVASPPVRGPSPDTMESC